MVGPAGTPRSSFHLPTSQQGNSAGLKTHHPCLHVSLPFKSMRTTRLVSHTRATLRTAMTPMRTSRLNLITASHALDGTLLTYRIQGLRWIGRHMNTPASGKPSTSLQNAPGPWVYALSN